MTKKAPKLPAWANKARCGPGYGGEPAFLSAPIWFDVSDLSTGLSQFSRPAMHHADLILRALFWSTGSLPAEWRRLRVFLHGIRIGRPERFIAELLEHGWRRDGDRLIHAETEARRNAFIRDRIDRKDPRKESKRLRFDVLEAGGFACHYCGRRPPEVELQVDHIEPISRGGLDERENMVASCADCNRGKASRILQRVGGA